jgi:pimeloyl-ACP methyl ester carboxylesterase
MLAHIQALVHARTISIAQRLSNVAVPVSLIWGRRDRLVPLLLGRRLQAAIPGATLDVIPDVGHFAPEEAPQRISESIAALLKR